jgi:hypothetical protein
MWRINKMTKTEAELLITTAEILITKGIPALMDFYSRVTRIDKKVPTIDDIRKAKGELDARKYFE